ncbi:MAG TPA: DUF3793 family protein [Feifaniaceae bacterium]|nr:DUF3793 family protein [Feifaniaceae bacterium]
MAYCAPTLAGLKTGGLFRAQGCVLDACKEASFWDRALSSRGVRLKVLHRDRDSALIYAYRPAKLMEDLSHPAVRAFLIGCGYEQPDSMEAALTTLSRRIRAREGFPHEIGLFLSYPLEDVLGFIRHNGRDFALCGCWKVYGDACSAARCFARYKKCAQIYLRQFELGRSIHQLTVAA